MKKRRIFNNVIVLILVLLFSCNKFDERGSDNGSLKVNLKIEPIRAAGLDIDHLMINIINKTDKDFGMFYCGMARDKLIAGEDSIFYKLYDTIIKIKIGNQIISSEEIFFKSHALVMKRTNYFLIKKMCVK